MYKLTVEHFVRIALVYFVYQVTTESTLYFVSVRIALVPCLALRANLSSALRRPLRERERASERERARAPARARERERERERGMSTCTKSNLVKRTEKAAVYVCCACVCVCTYT